MLILLLKSDLALILLWVQMQLRVQGVRAAMQSLDNIELLSGLTAAERQEIAAKCSWKTYSPGKQILEKSSTSRDVFFVVSGSVNIVNFGVSGREVAYATVEAGQYFGELSAIDGRPRSANVIANKECVLASMSPENFTELLKDHPEVSIQVLQRLARIIRVNDERILDLSTLGAVQRVCQELLRMAEPDPVTPGSCSFTLCPHKVRSPAGYPLRAKPWLVFWGNCHMMTSSSRRVKTCT